MSSPDDIIDQLKASRPDVQPRSAFRQELLQQLRQKMAETEKPAPSTYFSFPFSFMDQRFIFAGVGAVVGVFMVLVWPDMNTPLLNQTESDGAGITRSGIAKIEPQGFGSLGSPSFTGPMPDVPPSAPSFMMGQGGDAIGEGMVEEMTTTSDSRMIMPPEDYFITRFEYDGTINLPTDDVQVYRRVKNTSKPAATGISKGFAENLINWSAFNNLRVSNINLQQPNGYAISIDYNEGALSIFKEWQTMDRASEPCIGSKCLNQMPADEEVIRVAQNFVSQFGLDMSQYGQPVVLDDWRQWYERSEDKSTFYFPDQVSVVYPFLIDGKPVYEEHGSPFGVNIGVNIRTKEATSLYNYYLQQYEQSAYDPLTNEDKAREALSKGSMYSWHDENAKVALARLGEPTEGYMQYHQWNPDSQGNSLLVPALIFPVIDRDENVMDGRQNVILPLAADIYENIIEEPHMMDEPAVLERSEIME